MLFILQLYILFSSLSLDLFATSGMWLLFILVFRKLAKSYKFSILVFSLLLPMSIVEWNTNISSLTRKAKKSEYTSLNKAGIYNLNLIMGVTGYAAGYKEVAIETLLLGVPKKSNTVNMNSNFAMESKKVRSKISSHINSGRKQSKYTLTWSKKEHVSDSSRVALAVNSPAYLIITTENNKGVINYKCSISAKIKYPEGAKTKIALGHPGIYVIMDEAIFAGLQKSGVFQPYKIIWSWNTSKKDLKSFIDIIWFDDILEAIMKLR
jgi:hypothetical protein